MSVPYRIRVHPRARHVRLRMDPRQGLLITVPKSFDERRLPELIEQKRDWIEATQARHAGLRRQLDPAVLGPRPERVDLPALGQVWPVRYRHTRRLNLGFAATKQALTVQLPQQSAAWIDAHLAARLRGWLFDQAREYLVPVVNDLARTHGFHPSGVTIRNQRTRWGSCSSRGRISLNARLLFASAQACRYVVVHELVHIDHPDHSSRFWSRVAELYPDYRQAMSELNDAWQALPDWL